MTNGPHQRQTNEPHRMREQLISPAGRLPPEILVHIFSLLERDDYFNCMFVNRSWRNVVCTHFIYQNITLFEKKDLDKFLTLLEHTALNRQYPNRQSFYSRVDYGALVKTLSIPWTREARIELEVSTLKRLSLHCPNIETINLTGHWNLDDEKVVEFYKRCHRLKHLNLNGAFYATVEGLLNKDASHLRQQLKSLNVLNTYNFWSSSWDIYLPSLTELRMNLVSTNDFIGVGKLISSCRETLRALVLVSKVRTHEYQFAYLNAALPKVSNLKEFAFRGCSIEGREGIYIGPTVNNVELHKLSTPKIVAELLGLTNLKRLVLRDCSMAYPDINTILYNNRNTLETFIYAYKCESPLRFARIDMPINISHCQSLKCLLATVKYGDTKLDGEERWISDAYRNQIEHLCITKSEDPQWDNNYWPDGWWSQIVESPWPNIRTLLLTGIALSEEQVCKIPSIFPNIEYIYFDLMDKPKPVTGTFIPELLKLRHLKAAAGFQELSYMWPDQTSQSRRLLKQWQRTFNEWVKDSPLASHDDFPILSPIEVPIDFK